MSMRREYPGSPISVGRIRRVAACFHVSCYDLPFSVIQITVLQDVAPEPSDLFTAFLNVVAINPQTGEHEGAAGLGGTVEAAAEMAIEFFFRECRRIQAVKEIELADFAFQQPHGYYLPEQLD